MCKLRQHPEDRLNHERIPDHGMTRNQEPSQANGTRLSIWVAQGVAKAEEDKSAGSKREGTLLTNSQREMNPNAKCQSSPRKGGYQNQGPAVRLLTRDLTASVRA